MRNSVIPCAVLAALATATQATEFHVASNGDDGARGTRTAPLRAIQRAADLAQPGDVITVHQGVYRERINPPRGGKSDRRRIVYQAAPGETVEIKGSEVIKNWVKVENGTWKVELPNTFFGAFNPYNDRIRGDWFGPKDRQHHTGAVYLEGEWLVEAAAMKDVLNPAGTNLFWFAQVDQNNTTIWAQFKAINPNERLVEINVRQTVFYPEKPGRNYITVRGFALRHAATPWAPPTAEQIGLIGTHWSKGWIIEDNVVSHSVCSGIALGKHGDQHDNTSADTAEGYVKTIERAQAHPIAWTRENIGHHLVRNNTISHCEQAGIVGSLGAAFSTVTGNTIHDIHVRRLFTGAEMAGIKFHAAIDSVISHNHIYRTCRGLWLDWMAQGTRVSGNLFHDNTYEDLFVEVNHGPFLVDNNLFLSGTSLLDMSQGGAYAHNLFTGKIVTTEEPTRQTPYHPAHETAIAGLSAIKGGDNRFYNNIFVGTGGSPGEVAKNDDRHHRVSGYGLWVYDTRQYPLQTGGNLAFNHAQAYARETNSVVAAEIDPKVRLLEKSGHFVLQLTLGPEAKQARTAIVTTELLGQARIPGLPYLNADGSSLKIRTDYFGKKRTQKPPSAGPFELTGPGSATLEVW
jgi:alpha-L-arabinofuranosidase